MAKHICMEHSPSLTKSVLKAVSVYQDVVSWVLMSYVLYTVRGWCPSRSLPPLSGSIRGDKVPHKLLEQQLLA